MILLFRYCLQELGYLIILGFFSIALAFCLDGKLIGGNLPNQFPKHNLVSGLVGLLVCFGVMNGGAAVFILAKKASRSARLKPRARFLVISLAQIPIVGR
jgi:hypothetical protein